MAAGGRTMTLYYPLHLHITAPRSISVSCSGRERWRMKGRRDHLVVVERDCEAGGSSRSVVGFMDEEQELVACTLKCSELIGGLDARDDG
jgi:hypothetical protein